MPPLTTIAPPDQLTPLAKAVLVAADTAKIAVVAVRVELPDLPIVYLNRSAAELYGYAPEELLGKSVLMLVSEEHVDEMRQIAARRLEGIQPPPRVEAIIVRRDGTRIPVEASTSVVAVGEQLFSVAFVTDISARKGAQAALARSEEQFRRMIESAPEAIWILHASGLRYANPAALAMFGYERLDDAIGVDPRSFVFPSDVPTVDRRLSALLVHHERLPPHEYRVKRRDGSVLTIEVSAIAIEHEAQPAVLSFARDVSERKQIEAQLLQSDRLATLGMLAGGMSHAINNPLSYVLLDLEQLEQLLPRTAREPELLPEAAMRLKEAHQGAERIAAVVKRMRTFSRVDDQTRGPVDVKHVLEAAVEMVGNEIRHRGTLMMSCGEVAPVFGNPARLEQIFLNLLVQAAQALPESGEPGEVRLTVAPDGLSRVLVEVCCDLPEAAQPPEPQASRADLARISLAVCRSLVSSAGGELRVETHDPRASCFRVWLPTAGQVWSEPPPPIDRHSSQPAAGARAAVMVIDDDQGVCDALRLMLEDEHDVTCCASAQQALELIGGGQDFDIVFCDLMMPDAGGEELFERLRSQRPGLERKLVFMTGGAFTPEAVQFLARVPNPRIEKPFDLAGLKKLVLRGASG
jgi:two-component system, cell cycle sensor histidine kinase and response regulator CckA